MDRAEKRSAAAAATDDGAIVKCTFFHCKLRMLCIIINIFFKNVEKEEKIDSGCF